MPHPEYGVWVGARQYRRWTASQRARAEATAGGDYARALARALGEAIVRIDARIAECGACLARLHGCVSFDVLLWSESRPIDAHLVRDVAARLRALPTAGRLLVLLSGRGGEVGAAALLAEEFALRAPARLLVAIVGPVHSATTLAALAADALLMAPTSSLGPYDPHRPGVAGAGDATSPLDLLAGCDAIEEQQRRGNAAVAAYLLARLPSPACIGQQMRAQGAVEEIAARLLRRRMIPQPARARAAASALGRGHGVHDATIGAAEAARLGLAVRRDPRTDRLLDDLAALEAERATLWRRLAQLLPTRA